MTKRKKTKVQTPVSSKFAFTNYKPRQELEQVVAYGFKYLSQHTYYPEVIVGTKGNGKPLRVDGVIPELEHIVSIRQQKVHGSVDDKLLTEIQSLQDACDDYGWKKAILVISDPNNKMGWKKVFLSSNTSSPYYQRNKDRYPNVEVMEFDEFASRFFTKLP